MMMEQTFDAFVVTQDGTVTLHHPEYDEAFHSVQGARFEADSLYMQASGFRERMNRETKVSTCAVLDVGLGLGYNALMSIECWMQGLGSGELDLVSLEKTPELVLSLSDPACGWKEGWSEDWRLWSARLKKEEHSSIWRAEFVHPKSGRSLRWLVSVGDARQSDLSPFAFDFVWQDAFSPRKNGELWSVEWFQKLREASRPEVQLVSYSVARIVRDHLEAAGWQPLRVKTSTSKQATITGKKQWLLARLLDQKSLSTI